MKKYLLPQTGNFYKANLHAHTTVSDGEYSPEEVKKMYKEHGYSVVAFTDHHVMVPHMDLAEEDFLPLIGWEMGFGEIDQEAIKRYGEDSPIVQRFYRRNCDICCISPSPDVLEQPCYHRTEYVSGFMEPWRAYVHFDENEPDFERTFTPECINEAIKRHVDRGFFVTYNHPGFSQANYTEYSKYHGMHAMEICNFGSLVTGWPDYNEKEYEDMLRGGERIYCIATDDNHNHSRSRENYPDDSFGGFTMIKAEKLEYETLIKAMKAGNMYASQGPLIHELWLEDGKLHIICTDAERIVMSTASRRIGFAHNIDGSLINSASFDVFPEDGYVRLTVTDASGKHANTRAYFIDELFD